MIDFFKEVFFGGNPLIEAKKQAEESAKSWENETARKKAEYGAMFDEVRNGLTR